jgi:flagellin
MRIQTNVAALNSWRSLNQTNNALGKSLEKLSSGFRIGRAADDAAGLAISEKMRAQVRGLNQAVRNAQDGISLIQTAEGALNETHSILQRMRELAVQASNDTTTAADRNNIQDEVHQLAQELTRIANDTKYNTQSLMGDAAQFSGKFLIGADGGQTINVAIAAMDTVTLGVGTAATGAAAVKEIATVNGDGTEFVAGGVNLAGYTQATNLDIKIKISIAGAADTAAVAAITINGVTKSITADAVGVNPTFTLGSASYSSIFQSGQQIKIAGTAPALDEEVNISVTGASTTITGLDVTTQLAAEGSIATIDSAISLVSAERSKLGAIQNRLEHTISNLGMSAENLSTAESRIRDVDMAQEMMEFTKNNILLQAGTAMLAQANQAPQQVLQLLR